MNGITHTGRLTGTIATTVALAGCAAGGAAVHLTSGSRSGSASAPAAVVSPRASTSAAAAPAATMPVVPLPVPSASPSPLPAPAPAEDAAVLTAGPGAGETLQIIDSTGTLVASTAMSATENWSVVAGTGGVYWVDAGSVHELTLDGRVETLATIPASVDAFLVAPDGGAIAYATSTPYGAAGVSANRIFVQPFGGQPRLLAQRTSDPNHPSADAPSSWDYYLIRWTSAGIVFARAPQGGCGCGPFDMEMQSADTAIIDPASGATTDLTSSDACPLSGASDDGTVACFTGGPGSGATALRVSNAAQTPLQFTMSGSNDAGDAVFGAHDAAVAYITIPVADASCGGNWDSTLRVLDLATGAASAQPIDGLSTFDWGGAGIMYGLVGTATAASVITIDPVTLQTQTVWSGPVASSLVGLIPA